MPHLMHTTLNVRHAQCMPHSMYATLNVCHT